MKCNFNKKISNNIIYFSKSYIKYELVIPPWWKYEYDVIPEYSEEEILDELNREY